MNINTMIHYTNKKIEVKIHMMHTKMKSMMIIISPKIAHPIDMSINGKAKPQLLTVHRTDMFNNGRIKPHPQRRVGFKEILRDIITMMIIDIFKYKYIIIYCLFENKNNF